MFDFFYFLMIQRLPVFILFPYTTLFRSKQEVLGRIARERQLGEEHEIRTQLTLRAARGADDPLGVPLDVPDQEVHLRQRDPERLAHVVPAQNLPAIVSCLSAVCPAPGVVAYAP